MISVNPVDKQLEEILKILRPKIAEKPIGKIILNFNETFSNAQFDYTVKRNNEGLKKTATY